MVPFEPFHFKMVPFPPTTQTLLAAVPQIPNKMFVVPEVSIAQVVPFHFSSVPSKPVAHALFASNAHRLRRPSIAGVD